MPRTYQLHRRAIQMIATRARIVQAAVELYTERGGSATTFKDVGRRADVAPGTLRRHFPTRDDLDAAIVERATSEMPLPGLEIFDGAQTLAERVSRLVMATGVFLDQGAPWYRMWLREPMISGPWAEAGGRYGARWDELIVRALGPLAGRCRCPRRPERGLEADLLRWRPSQRPATAQVADLVTEVLASWLTAREADALATSRGIRTTAATRRRNPEHPPRRLNVRHGGRTIAPDTRQDGATRGGG